MAAKDSSIDHYLMQSWHDDTVSEVNKYITWKYYPYVQVGDHSHHLIHTHCPMPNSLLQGRIWPPWSVFHQLPKSRNAMLRNAGQPYAMLANKDRSIEPRPYLREGWWIGN